MEKEEEKKEITRNPFLFIALFGAIGAILALILYSFDIFQSLGAILLAFLVGVIFGLIFFVLSLLPEKIRGIVYIFFVLIVLMVLFLFIYKSTSISFIGSEMTIGIKNLFTWFKCLKGECPILEIEEEKEIQTPDFKINLKYRDGKIEPDGSFDLFIEFEVWNQKLENLSLYPYCYGTYEKDFFVVTDLQGYLKQNHFLFPKSNRQMKSSFRCLGVSSYSEEILKIGFNIPYISETFFSFLVSVKRTQGREPIESIEEGPFKIKIDLPVDLPLSNGVYDLFIEFKKNFEVELKKIDWVKIETSPETQLICDKLIDPKNLNLEEFWDKDREGYVFNCKLTVNGVTDLVEQRFIKITASYLVKKEVKKIIKKEK